MTGWWLERGSHCNSTLTQDLICETVASNIDAVTAKQIMLHQWAIKAALTKDFLFHFRPAILTLLSVLSMCCSCLHSHIVHGISYISFQANCFNFVTPVLSMCCTCFPDPHDCAMTSCMQCTTHQWINCATHWPVTFSADQWHCLCCTVNNKLINEWIS